MDLVVLQDKCNKRRMKKILGIITILCSLPLFGQSIVDGFDSKLLEAVEPKEYDFAGVWYGSSYKLVAEAGELISFQPLDSGVQVAFTRVTEIDTLRMYVIDVLQDYSLPHLEYVAFFYFKEEDQFNVLAKDYASSWSSFESLALYGKNALHFKVDMPEDGLDDKRLIVGDGQDLNVLWEFFRYQPRKN